jgi:hypothetical protein
MSLLWIPFFTHELHPHLPCHWTLNLFVALLIYGGFFLLMDLLLAWRPSQGSRGGRQ